MIRRPDWRRDVAILRKTGGINHAEMFPLVHKDKKNTCELFQIWINLASKNKMAEPMYKMLWSEAIPKDTGAWGEVCLIAGKLPGASDPAAPPPNSYAADPRSDVIVATVKLAANGSWTLPASTSSPAGLSRNVYFFAGDSASIDGKRFTKSKRVHLFRI